MTAAEPPPPTDPAARAPLLSVTVLNYNYGRFLGQCLDEVLAQSYPHFEVIVVDDCSQDDSLRVVEPYLADPRVRLVAHTTNQGFTRSLIEATEEHSRGEFVMVISADDRTLRPDAFARQLALLIERPDVAWVHTAFERFDSASGRRLPRRRRHCHPPAARRGPRLRHTQYLRRQRRRGERRPRLQVHARATARRLLEHRRAQRRPPALLRRDRRPLHHLPVARQPSPRSARRRDTRARAAAPTTHDPRSSTRWRPAPRPIAVVASRRHPTPRRARASRAQCQASPRRAICRCSSRVGASPAARTRQRRRRRRTPAYCAETLASSAARP